MKAYYRPIVLAGKLTTYKKQYDSSGEQNNFP